MTDHLHQVPNTAAADGPPPALLSYQQEWIADESAFKVMEKGRRTGVTWAEAADDVLIAASARSEGGQNVYYIGTEKEMTEEYIQACAMWAKVFNRAAGLIEQGFWDEEEEDKHILTFTIRFPSGFKIVALASRPRKLRGRQGVLVGDEAAFQDDLDELLKAAMAFLVWGGKVRLISTHDGADNQFNEVVQEIRARKRKGTLHRVTFRDAVDQGLYRRVCLRLGKEWSARDEQAWMDDIYAFYGDAAEEELDCVPRNSGGKFLSLVLIESRMRDGKPMLRFECKQGFEAKPDHEREQLVQEWLDEDVLPHLLLLDKNCFHAGGWDFGRTGDLSVFAPLKKQKDLRATPPFLVELRNVPFRQQEQICFFILDRLPKLMAAAFDARGNGQYLAEVAMQRYGARIHQVMLTEKWYGEQMPKFKAHLEDGTLFDLPKDADLRTDLRAFETIKGIPRLPDKKTKGADKGQRHGDAGIALVLADFASAQDFPEYDYEAVRTRRGPDEDAVHRDIRTTGGFKTQRGIL